MKANPVLTNEFQALCRIAQRRMDDGDANIEHESIAFAGDALRGQKKALDWLLRRVDVSDGGEVTMVDNQGPRLKSLDHLYSQVD